MEYNEHKAIYLQIAGMIYEKILAEEWKPTERIPAVRELSVMLEVTPNTVMRTYQLLESMNIITVKRGTGFYLTEDSYNLVFKNLREDYLQNKLPSTFRKLSLLKLTPDDVKNLYTEFLNNNK
jgi:DNA-binding transcriptional regulator YhcF (GntR family)